MTAISGEAVFDRIAQTQQLIGELEPILQSLMMNDSTMIDGLAQMLATMQHMQHRNEALIADLAADIRDLNAKLHQLTTATAPPASPAAGFDAADPEIGLLGALLPLLPNPVVLDVGANTGQVAAALAESGFEVFAFEPFPASYAALEAASSAMPDRLHAFPFAVGAKDGPVQLLLAADLTGAGTYDISLFHSTVPHPMLEDVNFTTAETVPMRALASLIQAGVIPPDAAVLKIDTEGADLDVIKGTQTHFPVVLMEFWDRQHPFGRAGHGDLADTVREMRARGYIWHIVLYRVDETADHGYLCNTRTAPTKSWGNAIFFRDFPLFAAATSWCRQAFPAPG